MPLLPTDDTRLCPYNKAHEILVTRWQKHLIKCRKQHPNSGIVICKYVWSHHIPKEEIESHEKECAKSEINVGNAATAEPTFEIPDPLRAHRPDYVVIDPEWEEEVPTYDPTAAAMSKPVIRLMQNMTKRERQEGREKERIRIRQLEEAAKKEKDAPKAEIPKVEGSMPRTLRRPNAENGPVFKNVAKPSEAKLRLPFLFPMWYPPMSSSIVSLRLEIKDLNTRLLDWRSVSEVLNRAKSLLEDKPKFLGFTDDISKWTNFYTTCQTRYETANESTLESLRRVKVAEAALMLKLDEYIKWFPIDKIEQAKRLIMDIKLPSECQDGNEFNDEEILTRIESMIKVLPNGQLFLAIEDAAQESKVALDAFADALICQGTRLKSESPVLFDIEILSENAKTALIHERDLKETQQSNGNSNLKVIFDQLLVWFDEQVRDYRINQRFAKAQWHSVTKWS